MKNEHQRNESAHLWSIVFYVESRPMSKKPYVPYNHQPLISPVRQASLSFETEKTDRQRQRQTETDRDRQRQTETDRDRQRQTETDRDRQRQTETDRHRLNAKRPACQSIQLTDPSQNSLTVAELLRRWWAHVVLSRSVTYTLMNRCVITGVVSWHAQVCYVCDHTFFVVLAHCA